jgi:hypothetical protein
MKKISILLSCLISSVFFAQVQTNGGTVAGLGNTNYFLDASGYEGFATSTGKLLGFPRVNLTQFQFKPQIAEDEVVLSFFDGAVVYNSADGNTLASVGDNNGLITAVTPGFYYFSNPNGASNGNVTDGVWTKLGSDTIKNYTSIPIKTATSIDGAQVWAVKGSFVASGTSALVSVTMPAGMTGYYKMTTYLSGKTFRSDISEFKMITTVLNTDNVVTGNGLFSEVYPAGPYDYTLEYFQ